MIAIKLGVAGTHSTGKSTLLDNLSEALTKRGLRVGRVADLARKARERGFPILRDHTFESTLWIMTRGISEQLEAGKNQDIVLVDRPALDALGYLWAALEHRGETLSVAQEDYLLALAGHDAASYQILCKTVLDHNIPLGSDRDGDLKFRETAGRQVDAVFARLELKPRVVVAGGVFVARLADEACRRLSDGPLA